MKKRPVPKSKKPTMAQPKKTPTRDNTAKANPSHEEVAKMAYFIYLDNGCQQGDDLEHWLAAEAYI